MNSMYERRNPHKLYRDKENALIAGVCAGIADYFGWNRKGMRLVTALLCLVPPFFPFMVISYVLLAIFLLTQPPVSRTQPPARENGGLRDLQGVRNRPRTQPRAQTGLQLTGRLRRQGE